MCTVIPSAKRVEHSHHVWRRSPDSTRRLPELARQGVLGRDAAKRQRRERGSISADEIINGAFEVAEEVSIDGMSMPQLAKHLDVGVTSIYWYFRKKDDLLNAMTDRALGRYDFATPFIEGQNWREALHNHARKMRETFRSNPILCDLILIRGSFGREASQAAFQKLEKAVSTLVEAGLSPEDAFDTYASISVHTRGSAVLERLQHKSSGDESRRSGGAAVIDPDTMPLIAELTGKGHRIGAADDINFEYGLNCILDHASQLIEANGSAAKGETARRAAR
jgi:AcrR family transcriptional regulator